MMRICALIEIEFFILMPWFKSTWSYSYLWSIIDGKIVEPGFLECTLVFLREDGDDLPLILQTKLFQKETLMVLHVQHLVKQFGLPDTTEQLSLFRLWLCDNCSLQVSQRELKTRFRYCLNPRLALRTVPTIVTAHIFCACQGSRRRRERNAPHAGHANWFCFL